LSALRAIYQSELGIAGNTSLTARILAFYQVQTVEQVLHLFTKRDGGRLTSASPLARTVLDAAEEGDATARQIVQAEGTMLGDYALAAARKVGIATTPFPLVLAGSVFRHESEIMTTAMVERINSQCPGITVLRSELEPSAGALVIAREATGGKVDRKIRAKLKLTSPPPGFFAT
jgi:N-acetylglucosamine kinase-like BadF-type ATPase